MSFFEYQPQTTVSFFDNWNNKFKISLSELQKYFENFDFVVSKKIKLPISMRVFQDIIEFKREAYYNLPHQKTAEAIASELSALDSKEIAQFLLEMGERDFDFLPVILKRQTEIFFRGLFGIIQPAFDFFLLYGSDFLFFLHPEEYSHLYEALWKEIDILNPIHSTSFVDRFMRSKSRTDAQRGSTFIEFQDLIQKISFMYGDLLSPYGQITCGIILSSFRSDSYNPHLYDPQVQEFLMLLQNGIEQEFIPFPASSWNFFYKNLYSRANFSIPVFLWNESKEVFLWSSEPMYLHFFSMGETRESNEVMLLDTPSNHYVVFAMTQQPEIISEEEFLEGVRIDDKEFLEDYDEVAEAIFFQLLGVFRVWLGPGEVEPIPIRCLSRPGGGYVDRQTRSSFCSDPIAASGIEGGIQELTLVVLDDGTHSVYLNGEGVKAFKDLERMLTRNITHRNEIPVEII